jgi:hypothetical protein
VKDLDVPLGAGQSTRVSSNEEHCVYCGNCVNRRPRPFRISSYHRSKERDWHRTDDAPICVSDQGN